MNTPAITPKSSVALATPVETKKEEAFSRNELIPSNWNVMSNDGETLVANNIVTNRNFDGPTQLFKKLLRGE